ncbi:MAG TPA: DUF2231 domain-containing protein [Candidatus Binataceae bacterium]|nr:DUF2231 domain-containing protein [Candidatus Binataceae bacterium]
METALRLVANWPGAAVLQNLHPLIVHYPIAMLTSSTVVYLAAAIARRDRWAWLALWLLAFGVLGATAAVWSGLRAGGAVMVAPAVRENILEYHERLMIMAWALSLLSLVWGVAGRPLPRRGGIGFLALLLMMSAVLARGADYGGWMVYGYNAGGSLPQPIEFSR